MSFSRGCSQPKNRTWVSCIAGKLFTDWLTREAVKTLIYGGSEVKASACNLGDLGSIPGLERSPGEGKGYPLQYSGLENSIDCIVTKSWTQLCDCHLIC